MINLTENGVKRSFNIDEMLYNDMEWLLRQARKPKKEIEKIAKQIELDQKNWDRFWKKVRNYRGMVEDVECMIGDKRKMLTEEEFEVVKQILGYPDEISDCCSADILGEDICSDCKEHCSKVYIF